MIIYEEQRSRLKELLSPDEYSNLLAVENDIDKFQELLDEYIFDRFDGNQEPTDKSDELERVYYEIYNQNK